MISRRRFLFDLAAGTAALTVSPGITQKLGTALLSPAPAAAPVAASFIQGHHSLLTSLQLITHRAQYTYDFQPTNHATVWHNHYSYTIEKGVSDLADLMSVTKIKDLAAARQYAHEKCMELKKNKFFDPCHHEGPLKMMETLVSHEDIHAHISDVLQKTLNALAHIESMKPAGPQKRSVSMDNMYMALSVHMSPVLQNGKTYAGRIDAFTEYAEGSYYSHTADNLKFLAELKFLREHNFLARIFTVPEKEQFILDTVEANPVNWFQLLEKTSSEENGEAALKKLNEAFPERAENARKFVALHKSLEDSMPNGIVPWLEIPWDVVVKMKDKHDAFMPLMQAAIDERKQKTAQLYREDFLMRCKGKTTFTQTSPHDANTTGLQGVLRGLFTIYPSNQDILDRLKNSFSSAVSLTLEGDDIVIDAKEGINQEDRLLLENLSGKNLDNINLTMPVKEVTPIRPSP